MSDKRVIVQIPVSETEKKALKKLAVDRGISMGQMIREALVRQLLEKSPQ